MQVKNPKQLPCGTFLYGYALHYSHDKNTFSLRQEPILGMLAAKNTYESNKDKVAQNPGFPPCFFVPLKKNKEPLPENCAWSRAVDILSRRYATTEDTAREDYNAMIEKLQKFHKDAIKELEYMKL